MWEEDEDAGSGGSGSGSGGRVRQGPVNKESRQHDLLFNDLMHECKHSAPGARLSARLRTELERLRPEARRAVVSRTRDGCAPLFVACRRGNVEIVEYLVHVCCAELEQRGRYEVPDERGVHTVTPLWCAAVSGRLEVLRVLAEAGADVDAGSDSGSSPVRSACFMTHVEVVRYLLARGADLHAPNHHGGTALINSVQSPPLCALLLAHGAHVNATDMQLKTALHYAIQEHRVDTARLLLDHGADPEMRSRAGDDALRTACLKGAAQIVSVLMSRVRYAPARAADAYELLGATMLDEFNDPGAALAAWRKATATRLTHQGYIAKRPLSEPVPLEALGGAAEWETLEQLEALAGDMDALRTQALLVCARVLGLAHKDTVFRLMYRGASYADAFRYQRCIDLWSWALDIRIQKDTLLYNDTCHTACALTRLMLDAAAGRLERATNLPRFQDVLKVFNSVATALPLARAALRPAPVHKKQAETFDRALRCVTHLMYLLLHTATCAEERVACAAAVRRLVAADVRSAHTRDSLLHLCVSRLNTIKSTFFADELSELAVFPHVGVARLLLACGADVRLRNEARSTPLHVAAIPYNCSPELIQVLLEGGAHLDTPNKFGDSACELLALGGGGGARGTAVLCPLRHVTLACLAARAVLRAPPPYRAPPRGHPSLPATLHDFLDLHRA